jgi:hypothetical protein
MLDCAMAIENYLVLIIGVLLFMCVPARSGKCKANVPFRYSRHGDNSIYKFVIKLVIKCLGCTWTMS